MVLAAGVRSKIIYHDHGLTIYNIFFVKGFLYLIKNKVIFSWLHFVIKKTWFFFFDYSHRRKRRIIFNRARKYLT